MNAARGRARQTFRRHGATLACAALLLAFAALSWSAVSTKSPTGDEPLHALGAYVKRFCADFRVDPEDPPLFGYWAMLPHGRRTLEVDVTAPAFARMLDYMWQQWDWVVPTLFRTPGNHPDRFIARSRAMMLLLGVALGAVIALWARQLAGPVAMVAATALYALDPNFLAHAPLVKNDVPLALLGFALAYATWRAGERLTLTGSLAIGLLLGAALSTKFSGLLLAPVLALLLTIRALVARPWIGFGRIVTSRLGRLAVSAALLGWSGAACAGVTWLCYGLRYAPTPDPAMRLNMPLIARAAARTELIARDPSRDPTAQEIDAHPPSRLTRAVLLADRHKLLPHAWLAGLLDTYATTRVRPGYLLGEVRRDGWWYFFPLAMLFKTPLATLCACAAAALVVLVVRLRSHEKAHGSAVGFVIDRWGAACLVVPMLVYGLSLLTSSLNIGLRHALPLYPPAYVFVGVVVAGLVKAAPRATVVTGLALLLGLGFETVRAHPNYIPFFNLASESRRLHLLGDSNLDWGQDLKLLAQWRRAHPQTPLYFCHFGGVDPRYYVPDMIALRGSDPPDLPMIAVPDAPGVIAVSATHLQGIYRDPATAGFYQLLLRRQRPIEVLGGSIYLFEWPVPR